MKLPACFIALLLIVSACKKEETISLQEPTACFSVVVQDGSGAFRLLSTTRYIDSSFYFFNCSDSGTSITYHWNFGDGTTSTEKSPKHKYQKRGKYTVTLTVSNKDIVNDTMQNTVSVILGQKQIANPDESDITPIAFEELATSNFVLLTSSGYGPDSRLMHLDSLLNTKTVKVLPANYYLNSMQLTNDGNLIFTGSTLAANKNNELVKMTLDGTPIWSRLIGANDNYTFASQTADGGYVLVGSRPFNGQPANTDFTVVSKTDANGNLQWQKFLTQEPMINAKNAVAEPDGIVVAGVKPNLNGYCYACDSTFILKLDNTGNLVWKRTVLMGQESHAVLTAYTSKLSNGNYAVSNESEKTIFFFSPTGQFVDRITTPYKIKTTLGTADGDILLSHRSSPGDRFGMAKFSLDGYERWWFYPQEIPCCRYTSPTATRRLRAGGTMYMGYWMKDNSSGTGIHRNIVMLQLDDDGKVK